MPTSDNGAATLALRWLERALLLVGVLLLAYFGFVSLETRIYQELENRELNAILAGAPSTGGSVARPRRVLAAGERVGRIEIPRLQVSAIVRAGTDARTLRLAVGHIAGTALPGEADNVGLAGHRDTFFQQLQHVRGGDEIRIVTPEGNHMYRVERTLVVEPEDVWVLQPTTSGMLTLVTCYPFSYIGAAPQRFIVRASLVGRPPPQGARSQAELQAFAARKISG